MKNMELKKIIIVDDHRLFRESICKIIVQEQIGNVVAEASNGKELLNLLKTFEPDIVLMDIAMPEMDGIEATKKALAMQPGLKILTTSSFSDQKYYFSMLEAGAKGFLLKTAGIFELRNAIAEIAKGNSWFSPELLQGVIKSLHEQAIHESSSTLTDRESEIVKLVCESLTNEQISNKLHISLDTVKWHRTNILSKTGCANTAGLVIYAIKNKIIEI
ncbi:MAG: response regulator transcription factor [Breznakibacter sp.]